MADKYIDLSYRDATSAISAPKQVTASITGISKANGAVITAANDFSNGDLVRIAGAGGMTEINNLAGTVASASATQFTVTEINSTAFTTYTSGGTATKIMGTTGDIRVIYKDTVPQDCVFDALIRANEKLAEVFAAS